MGYKRKPFPIAHMCGVEHDTPVIEVKGFQHLGVCNFEAFKDGFFRNCKRLNRFK